MDNRFKLTGTVSEMYEMKQLSPFFRKREFKIRISDTDFQNKVVERNIKFGLINQDVPLLDNVRVDDIVSINFYLDGRDVSKDGKTSNYTSVVCYELEIISSPTRETKEDKNISMIQGGNAPLKQSTLDELMITPVQDKDEFPVTNTIDEFGGLPF